MDSHPDDGIVDAIHILADAVRAARVPGVVEFRQLEKALAEAVNAPTPQALAQASAAFRAMDGELREEIAAHAFAAARTLAASGRRLAASAVEAVARITLEPGAPKAPQPRTPRAPQAAAPRAASPFLAALNRRSSTR